jgi:hypothetical protein
MVSVEVFEKRLDRIESKLDQVSTTLTHLARIDERLTGGHKRIDRHEQRLDQLEDSQRVIETRIAETMGKSMVVERGAWIVFAAVASVITQIF